jgi:arginyl-tRNA synthetase
MKDIIIQAIAELYGLDSDVELSRTDAEFGDYSTNVAMRLAKPLGKTPRDIAESIREELLDQAFFTEVRIGGPGFINLRVDARYLADTLGSEWSESYGNNQDGAGKRVVVEYPSPNMAKPYSVGHLRPGNQGWAIRNLMKATGWDVITDNHLGDYGTPFGAWIVGFLHFGSENALEEIGIYELGEVYIKVRQALKEEQERGEHALADEVQDWLLKLERGDAEALEYSRRFNEISLNHIHHVMGRLGISTDYELGEAFFAPRGKVAVADLVQRDLATGNQDGSIVADLSEQGIDTPILLQKSNGAALYATNDLATILYREIEWHPDRVIYVAGSEQQFYFTQLFALAKKLGITTELIHVWFGVIDQLADDGTRAKMSSRKGVVLMEQLLDAAEDHARAAVEGRNISDEDLKKVALGAVKFTDFAADRRTNILFDWDRIFSLTGFSGPYVQYAAVRVNAILRDNLDQQSPAEDYDYVSEKAVIMKLLDFPAVVKQAADGLEPHRVAAYVYELARELNRYYEQTPVATGDVEPGIKAARLQLLQKTAFVFESGLGLLGIDVPAKM